MILIILQVIINNHVILLTNFHKLCFGLWKCLHMSDLLEIILVMITKLNHTDVNSSLEQREIILAEKKLDKWGPS